MYPMLFYVRPQIQFSMNKSLVLEDILPILLQWNTDCIQMTLDAFPNLRLIISMLLPKCGCA